MKKPKSYVKQKEKEHSVIDCERRDIRVTQDKESLR
jgi:hypothetical protein